MKITVYGSGYVGLVVAACFARVGNNVLCMDVNEEKVQRLQRGEIPIYEPGLDVVVHEAIDLGNLHFTSEAKVAAQHGEYQFIAVGTPPDEKGNADLKYVLGVAKCIGTYMKNYTIVVNKSTVPIGTADKVHACILNALQQRQSLLSFAVVSNPEFLREGHALEDFQTPDRIVLGVDNPLLEDKLCRLYAPFNPDGERIVIMDRRSAELTKYTANAMLATKISFINEIANLSEKVGADIKKVALGVGMDHRIGPHFIQPGCGYGGSCFGKDIQALIHTAREYKSDSTIIQAVERVNQQQKLRLFEKVNQHYPSLHKKVFAVWGLAFKPETDDMRDAPSIPMVQALLKAGALIQAYDPKAMGAAQKVFSETQGILYGDTPEEVLEGADALIILTEWETFLSPDFENIKLHLRHPVIFDGRNLYDPVAIKAMGFTYYGIGRGA